MIRNASRSTAAIATIFAVTVFGVSMSAAGDVQAQPAGPGADPNLADDGLYVIVEATHRPLDAVLVIPPKCGIGREACGEIRAVIHNDMRLSGVVRALEVSPGKAAAMQKSAVPRFDVRKEAAKKAGVTWAIGTTIRKSKRNKKMLSIELQVLNVKTAKMLNLGRRATTEGPFSKLRVLAHRAANAIFGGLTGVEGSFDGQFYYSSPGPKCARCIWMADGDGYNARIVVGDKGIHMLPRPSADLGVLYVSFRTELPSLFRLRGPEMDFLWNQSANVTTPPVQPKKRRKKRRKRRRGKKKASKAPIQDTAGNIAPKLPASVLKPFATHDKLQYRTATQATDGRIVATINDGEQADLWLLDHKGRPIRNLTNHEADDLDPSWAPDGQRIAFVSNRSGRPQIYIVRLDGTGLERITFAGPYNTGPDWGPNGKIVYSGLRGGAVDILTVDAAKQMQRLTPGKGKRSLEPSWTSCGRRVIYVSDEDGGGPRMWVASHDGAVRHPLALGRGRYYTPVWRKRPGQRPRTFRP